MQLIYRGYTVNYIPRPVQTYRKPNALNWRWQGFCENVQSAPQPIKRYCPPRALNWRFQMQTGMPF